jgi:hypothetical protein
MVHQATNTVQWHLRACARLINNLAKHTESAGRMECVRHGLASSFLEWSGRGVGPGPGLTH